MVSVIELGIYTLVTLPEHKIQSSWRQNDNIPTVGMHAGAILAWCELKVVLPDSIGKNQTHESHSELLSHTVPVSWC